MRTGVRCWDRVVPSGVPGVAAADASDRQPRAPDRPVLGDRFERVLRARRGEPAVRGGPGKQVLVATDERGREPRGGRSARAVRRRRGRSGGGEGAHQSCSRAARSTARSVSRSSVVVVVTAEGPALEQVSAARDQLGVELADHGSEPTPEPVAFHRTADRSRHCVGHARWLTRVTRKQAGTERAVPTGRCPREFPKRCMVANVPDQAESRARPRRRRVFTTLRPAWVRIRRRNPCFLLRFRWFGWKVRFTHGLLERVRPGVDRHPTLRCGGSSGGGRWAGPRILRSSGVSRNPRTRLQPRQRPSTHETRQRHPELDHHPVVGSPQAPRNHPRAVVDSAPNAGSCRLSIASGSPCPSPGRLLGSPSRPS